MTDETAEACREGERERVLALVDGPDVAEATAALLSLTYDEPDRPWLEDVLLERARSAADVQVRQLAVSCLGHVARIHRAGTAGTVIPALQGWLPDPELGARARNALEDVEIFVGRDA